MTKKAAGSQSIGMVGLGPMGRNLALNLSDHGHDVAVYDRFPEVTRKFVEENPSARLAAAETPTEFVSLLKRPRRIILLVKAGAPVDATLDLLKPLLDPKDLVVDGGNEQFTNTERRAKAFQEAGFGYLGMGVSGGEEGARNGPSLMPGGDRAAYDEISPLLLDIAAKIDDGACCDYIGPGGSGHFVKMVHNGIEYGDMQLIAESYDLLKILGGLSNDQLADTFDEWNRGDLQSFLIEITARIFRKRDTETSGHLIDQILDVTGMKGTGSWTVEQASGLSAPIPTIASAVEARVLSAKRVERLKAAELFPQSAQPAFDKAVRADFVADIRKALYASKLCSYAQGMGLLRLASEAHGWNLKLGSIARLWKGGCIIRAAFLDHIRAAYHDAEQRGEKLDNLLFADSFAQAIREREAGLRRVVTAAVMMGVPVPGMAASLTYFDTTRRARLPANLLQAQRDYFGAHTYERIDRPGSFHSDWTK